jgi:adenylate cyclase
MRDIHIPQRLGARLRRRYARAGGSSTFVFADLVGYTALTEARGSQAAARVAHEFQRAMDALGRDHRAPRIKRLGDGVMILAPDPAAAIALAARAVCEVGTRPDLLPVRVGVHTGPAVRLGSDWYGSAVNIASRLASAAQPNEALVSSSTSAATYELPEQLGARRQFLLRGVERPVAAWTLA